ncbi:Transposase IS66 family protein [Planctomycetes bacterium Pla86]|uniref:Transposase IS66 family protein n=1 Tax=Engelhardtia mirabilis TaxID=2528011 RepID=A0A518BS99_9BACT|nr:Transposase IS66 family protein [Planctomycetes bacterium Pla133]QDU69844.1 Transposase IS66 family protein [Planctomycetes bacterium Pla133]QDV04161.1 Transposase IS66 family protein [Planctomycetes bacterium Pla86]QDV04170.1 Transposase IS66 family protein [Planctomycetes bacterium Pla86]
MTKVACWAHARRKFWEALTSATADASTVLAKIQRLYRVEKEARDAGLAPDAVGELRQSKSRPILASIHQDLERLSKSALPKSPVGKAVAYTLNLWEELVRHVDDGRIAIDNNSIERAMRAVAVGRKNWLFCGGESGGQRAAVIYSLVETCKRLDVEPFEYLRDVLSRIREHPADGLESLTPRGWRDARSRAVATIAG